MQWAQFPREYASAESARQAARNIRQGKVKALDKNQFEVVTQDKVLWIRFLADDEGQPPEPAEVERDYSPSEVRRWAKRVGMEVGAKGRLSPEVIEAYRAHVEDNTQHGVDDDEEGEESEET
jgi:2-hydroxychromene-2-carboxylate isomerase